MTPRPGIPAPVLVWGLLALLAWLACAVASIALWPSAAPS